MLGQETDLILIDILLGRVYNFGDDDSGIDKAHALIDKIMPHSTPEERAKRYVLISGIEIGYEKIIGCRIKCIYNSKVFRRGKYFSSQY
jgi:hypothetical protein